MADKLLSQYSFNDTIMKELISDGEVENTERKTRINNREKRRVR